MPFMDQPKIKNVYEKNLKLIQVLYSVCADWQSLHDCMLIQYLLISKKFSPKLRFE